MFFGDPDAGGTTAADDEAPDDDDVPPTACAGGPPLLLFRFCSVFVGGVTGTKCFVEPIRVLPTLAVMLLLALLLVWLDTVYSVLDAELRASASSCC